MEKDHENDHSCLNIKYRGWRCDQIEEDGVIKYNCGVIKHDCGVIKYDCGVIKYDCGVIK